MKRKITTYGNYFKEFYNAQTPSVQEKIDYVFELVKTLEFIPPRFFQHLESTDSLFEIRVEYGSNIYRIFCFFDEGNVVVLINAFQKKTQKTPKNELDKAIKLKKQYFIDKQIDNDDANKKKIKR